MHLEPLNFQLGTPDNRSQLNHEPSEKNRDTAHNSLNQGRISSPEGQASNRQLPELKESEKNVSDVPDWTDKAEDMLRQQVSSFTSNSQKL